MSEKTNITDEILEGHRFGKKLTNKDYGTMAYLIPKSDILPNKKDNEKSFLDKELKYNCIYFLIGYEVDAQKKQSIEKMYVGQAGIRDNEESVLDRLWEHKWFGKDPIVYSDKWTDIVVFTNEKGAWGATELDALEHIFWSLIPVGNRYNSIKPSCTGADVSMFTEAVKQIKEYLNYLQYTMFKEKTDEVITQNVNDIAKAKSELPVDLDRGTTSIPNITTPPRIVEKMLDMLPEDVWNDETVFLDPACKDGGFLRAIYDRLKSNSQLLEKYDNNTDKLKNHILSKQIYGIALNQNSKAVTIDTLDGFEYNIRVIPDYIRKVKCNRFKDIISKEFEGDMKFDVVIGNPPYQESTYSGLNESGGKALFDSFIINGVNVTDRILCMITPTKWIAGGQKNFIEVRKKLLEGKHLANMVEVFNPTVVFPGTQIAGGVSYFLYDNKHTGKTDYTSVFDGKEYKNLRDINGNDIIPRHYIGETVINKIRNHDQAYLSSMVNKDLWKLPTNFNEGSVIPNGEYSLEVITPRGSTYVEPDMFNNTDCYKVIFTRAVSGSTYYIDGSKSILSSIRVLKPGQICNASYMVVSGINKEEYANNIKTYLETKFVRFLILQTLFGIGLTPDRFRYVPLMDFTKQWTDEELYRYYGLDNTEIEFIENIIKPITPQLKSSQAKLKLTKEDVQANYINKMVNNI